MCPLWPFHTIIFYIVTLYPVWVICQAAPKLMADFHPEKLEIHMGDTVKTYVNVSNFYDENSEKNMLQIYSESDHIATPDFAVYELTANDTSMNFVNKQFNVSANFLGKTRIKTKLCSNVNDCIISDKHMDVIVTRQDRIIDHVFTGSVATLVSLIYINFGCALDWPMVKATIRKPIGPVIGFCTQFLLMPLISYGFGLLLFPESVEMQLGMFFTGISPGGGASNIWTYVLEGNLNLSIAMTTISTFAAFGMMPLWLFTLGRTIFKSGNMKVPYTRIAGFAVGLVVPLGLGLLAQKYLPRFAKIMVRILKGFSSFLLLFIIVFAIITNLYLFELFSWKIIIAGMCVPWCGYLFGYISAYLFRQSPPDCLAIALETGIQNTGISIFLLRFSLGQPEADLTTVVPVSIAIMTPIPMIFMFLYIVIKKRFKSKGKNVDISECENEPHKNNRTNNVKDDGVCLRITDSIVGDERY